MADPAATPSEPPTPATPAVYDLPLSESEAPPVNPIEQVALDHSRDLQRQNAAWFCRLRWIVIAILGAAGMAGALLAAPLGAIHLNLRPQIALGAAVLLAILNLAYLRRLSRMGDRPTMREVRALLWTQIIADLLVLTGVIHWLGSTLSWAPYTYLFHIVLACVVLEARHSLLVVALAGGLYSGCLLLEVAGVFPPMSVLTADSVPAAPTDLSPAYLAYSVGAMLLVWLVIWHLVSRLARNLHQRETEAAANGLVLEASCDERAAHMLQTTHQLKAPFAAIHAQTQLLLGGYCGELQPKARETVEKISRRCLALSRQIQEMLQLANLRSQGQTAPGTRDLDLATLLEKILNRVDPSARQRRITLQRDLTPAPLTGVEDHLTMLFDNLIVNAVNYSRDDGRVEVSCQPCKRGRARVIVRDHGIGIPEKKLPHVFEDYYRTDEALAHNRSSTGLGLAVVRQVARTAGATVRLESAPGWGTRFTVTLPCNPPTTGVKTTAASTQ
jgi:signal transduction histidine kinase